MKRRSAPVDIAALRKLITLDPKRKNVCTACRHKMRPPGRGEEPTPTCDNCAHDIVLDMLPKLLDELEAARAKPAEPAPKKKSAESAPKKKVAKARPVKPPKKASTRPKLRIVPNQPEPEPEPVLESEPEPEPEPEPEKEIDQATDVSELALKLEEEKKDEPKRRRIVKFVPANPQEVQDAVVRLRDKFER